MDLLYLCIFGVGIDDGTLQENCHMILAKIPILLDISILAICYMNKAVQYMVSHFLNGSLF